MITLKCTLLPRKTLAVVLANRSFEMMRLKTSLSFPGAECVVVFGFFAPASWLLSTTSSPARLSRRFKKKAKYVYILATALIIP